jgi:glycosyltransferase involved in cell wall biosynthesis
MRRTRILLLIPRMRAGGAEQVMKLVASGLSREKYEIHLGLVMADEAGAHALPAWVTVHALGARRARNAGIPLLRLIWRLRPHVILSGAPEISFMVLLLRVFFPADTRIVVRQNGTVSAALATGGVPGYTRLLYRLLYRRADRVICQSRAMAEDLQGVLRISPEKLAVLANPVDVEGVRAAKNPVRAWSGPGPHLLAVGRLSRVKGFDLLIESLVQVRGRFPDADLTIVGAGREELALKQLRHNLGLQNVVHFAGQIDRPYTFFVGATLYVLSSRCEGMPNALLEAAAAGLPLVATPASGGIVDLLRGRHGAWLAAETNASALSAAIIEAIGSLRRGERFHHEFFASTRVENACAAGHQENESSDVRCEGSMSESNPKSTYS